MLVRYISTTWASTTLTRLCAFCDLKLPLKMLSLDSVNFNLKRNVADVSKLYDNIEMTIVHLD